MTQVLPSIEDIYALHHKYATNDKVYELVIEHCKIVSEIALRCADNIGEDVNRELLERAALLHDVGSYAFLNEDGEIINKESYPQHAILGARILADEGISDDITVLISTHVKMGITKQEIINKRWKLPARDYEPHTIEGDLLCYADRFHSKRPVFNAYDTLLNDYRINLPLQSAKFESASKKFGIPDIESLAKKYNHPIE